MIKKGNCYFYAKNKIYFNIIKEEKCQNSIVNKFNETFYSLKTLTEI